MALRDLSKYLEDDRLDYPTWEPSFSLDDNGVSRFPVAKACSDSECKAAEHGRHCHYRVPSPDAKTGLWLTGLADLGMAAFNGTDLSDNDLQRLQLNDDQEKDFYRRVLGPVHDEMVADGVKWTALQRVAQDAYVVFAMDEQIADAVLAGGQGEAEARGNRATRRAVKKTAGRRSSPASGAATPTPSAAATGSSTSPATQAEQAKTG